MSEAREKVLLRRSRVVELKAEGRSQRDIADTLR